ncbi:hypothetical protein LEP1GSC050_2893 [Leptospira broomii serovar Hurstbridge str. 5399]|uniref:Uncharacterized protein n=4 Tax=Leptospira TaxID=171 RepID=V6HA25_9LEPT|nr:MULTISPECIES: hypothetical protein [Leptospira]EPG73921.1 hypothetical protein LEP1GSC058_2916 [Leptospira fainei serovar Hurstbridge str. BUT 6]EQA35143.1 hypothetical protein LEP1GSC047_1911 [Leptospira inadai serovar Lyme str. 10]EQA46095.1 hypothetical protein LEP1GSC050_2893 [Leptospira broomii serovar Hurstbridge str. 5399]PNV74584.1 hypothetical protein BES34_012650 [Leptospira inadai serovar Lyme]
MSNFLKGLLYPLFAASMAFGFYSQYRTGGASTEYETISKVPKTVRQNPGIYRSHYNWFSTYSGGK